MKQNRTPILESLIKHSRTNPFSFHVPGHKYGNLFQGEGMEYFKELLKIDATELSGLDDLHSPEGPIMDAEKLLTQLYGVKKSFFLVNGSTVGNLAMIMGTIKENDIVLVQRNCHKSILNGIGLVNADPVFLGPDFEKDWGVAGTVSLNTVKQALEQYPQAKVIILTYPNYYGMVNELEEIITLSHSKGIPVLVDEAHGAHFVGGEIFPKSAVQLKADIVVQSAHKTLPAMTMGAYLHYNSNIVSEKAVSNYLHILQSSSPSYPIMASLDMARSYLATFSEDDAKYLLEKLNELRKRLQQLEGIEVLAYPCGKGDPLKITIQSTTSLSGYEIQAMLEKKGIYSELADPYNVLLVFPLLKKNNEFPISDIINRFEMALQSNTGKEKLKKKAVYGKPPISKLALKMQERANLKKRTVPYTESIGHICAQLIIPYPPGIPLLFPGEIITMEDIENIRLLQETGAKFQDMGSLSNGKIDIYLL